MEKKTQLINIYLKINQKRDLSWEDLEYLARFDPECFEKTCRNVVYNIPQVKAVILSEEEKTERLSSLNQIENKKEEKVLCVEQILDNLRHMEIKQLPIADVDVERVKNLLGNLYMELLFPHNDREDAFFSAMGEEKGTIFDRRA